MKWLKRIFSKKSTPTLESQIEDLEEEVIPRYNISELEEVSEDMIKMAANKVSELTGNANNNFYQLLLTAREYRALGVEPVFLVTKNQQLLRVASKEVYDNPRILN